MDVDAKIDRTSLVGIGISGSEPCATLTKEELFKALGADLRLVKPADSKEPSPCEPAVKLIYVGLDNGGRPKCCWSILMNHALR